MNIEGVNLSSPLSGNSPVEVGVSPVPGNVPVPEGFANALMGQLALLGETNGQTELPAKLQDTATPEIIENLNDIGGLLAHNGDEKELAALFDEYLSLYDKKNGPVDINEDAGPEATLFALADVLNPTVPSIAPDEVAAAQNMSLALTGALKSITQSTNPDEVVTAQNMSDVMALNGLSFVKPLPEEAKLNMVGEESVASGDFLQKETVLCQLSQDKQGLNLQYIENAEPTEKTLVIEKQAVISGIEKTTPSVAADMMSPYRPFDNRMDNPTITKPLTHPDWSKDLGEQIVWMNGKTIPAAEIRLNPAHLGPISVRIDVNQDQASIIFTAQHAEVKEAIEASIPKLREMLATQQLNLTNVNISQNSTSDQQGRPQSQTFPQSPENHEQGIDSVIDTTEKTGHDRVVVSKGLLSLYA